MLAKKHLALLLTSCLCFSIPLMGCGKSSSEKTVQEFLDAYQNQNHKVMDSLLQEPGSLGTLYAIQGLPESVTKRYQSIFTDFTYEIEREVVSENTANVYVKMTYKDAGTPSIAALSAYQEQAIALESDTVSSEEILLLLEENFTAALSQDLTPIEEILVVPVVKTDSGQWQIVASGEFQNALTGNMDIMVTELEYFNSEPAGLEQ
jgi:hypothetical protein